MDHESKSVKDLVNLIRSQETISKSLITVHNLCVHLISFDKMDDKEQLDIYSTWQLIEAIQAVEKELQEKK